MPLPKVLPRASELATVNPSFSSGSVEVRTDPELEVSSSLAFLSFRSNGPSRRRTDEVGCDKELKIDHLRRTT
jgi:hypothetical protein